MASASTYALCHSSVDGSPISFSVAGVGLDASVRAKHWALIVALVLLTRIPAAVSAIAPARDATRYWRAAVLLETEPLSVAVRQMDCHPLYPATLSMAHALVAWFGEIDGPSDWLRASQLVGIASTVLFMISAYEVGCRLWTPTISLLGCLLVQFLPRQVHYSVDVLGDVLHAALWMTSVLFLLRSWERPRWRDALACGAFAGAAYWTRTEALLLPIVALLATTVRQCVRSWRLDVRSWATICVGLWVGLASLAAPYAITVGSISPTPTSKRMMSRPDPWEPVARYDVFQPAAALAPRESSAPLLDPDRAPLLAARRVVVELAQETRVLVLAWALLALVTPGRRRLTGPHAFLVVALLLAYGVLLVGLRMRAGFLAGRYFTPTLPFLAMWASAGLVQWNERWRQGGPFPWEREWDNADRSRRRQWAFAGAVSLLVLVGSVAAWSEPLHRFRYGHMLAARWIAERAGARDKVVDDVGQVGTFAAHDVVTSTSAPAWTARFAVIEPAIVPPFDPSDQSKLDPSLRVVVFPQSKEQTKPGIYVVERRMAQASVERSGWTR